MELLRDVNVGGYRLTTWDTGSRDWRGQTRIAYRFVSPGGETVFRGADFSGSPLHAGDSDESLRSLLGFLTLRPGDTDAEYFNRYTQAQMAFARGDAEELQMWVVDPSNDDDSPAFEDWEGGEI